MAIQSIILQHCWVCGAKFIEHGGSVPKNVHHIVPQAYGGTNGPTVTLCDDHHSVLHRVGTSLVKGDGKHNLLLGTNDPEQIQKLLWLAGVVANAELKTRNDPNKKASVVLPLDAITKNKVDRLKLVLNTNSRASVIMMAINSLYGKYFDDNESQ